MTRAPALGLLLLLPVLATAEPPPETPLAEVLAGFDDDDTVEPEPDEEAAARRFRLGGGLELGTSYSFAHDPPAPHATDWRGLTRLRPELTLELEARPADALRIFISGRAWYDLAFAYNGRQRYSETILDRHESEAELRDAFLELDIGPHLDLTVGRQIVAWGLSETFRVTDVLNPLDLREPGLEDVEDLRLPLAMTRLESTIGRWRLAGIAIHEMRFDTAPAPGHEFYPWPAPLPQDERPPQTIANSELGLSATGNFAGWDLSLYLARFSDDRPHVELEGFLRPVLRHSRLHMVGAAWDLAVGDMLLKAEAAHLRGLEFFHLPTTTLERSELLLGVEYLGWAETWITLEAVERHLHGHRPEIEAFPDLVRQRELDWSLRVTRTFLHQTLSVTLLALTIEADGSGGALQRLQASYDIDDHVEVTGGVVLYQSGDRPGFENVGDSDRFFLEIDYLF